MPPIRKGDGTVLSPKGIAEVRKGDGTVIYSAGSAIPDIGMFQSPVYQFWAGEADEADGTSGFGFPEVLAGLSDATAVGGPIYQTDVADGDGDTFDAGEYDGVDDGHDWTPDASLPTGDEQWSMAALAWVRSNSTTDNVIGWGDRASTKNQVNFRFNAGKVSVEIYGVTTPSGTTDVSGAWATIGASYDQSQIAGYANGGNDFTQFASGLTIQDANHTIGYRAVQNDSWADMYLAEIIVSDVAESATTFSNYHADRLG